MLNRYYKKHLNARLNLINQAKIKDLQKQFESITNQENNIHSLTKDGIINLIEATNMIAMTDKKKLDIKEKLVATVHVTTDGIPRAISTEPNNQGFYRTKMPDGKHLLSKTREGLLDKLIDYYGVTVGSNSIKDVFEQADEYYITAHNYDPVETGKRHKQDFNRYFSKIKNSDICEWNKDKFNAYIKDTVTELQIIESALGKFQAITNIIFGYAITTIMVIMPVVMLFSFLHWLMHVLEKSQLYYGEMLIGIMIVYEFIGSKKEPWMVETKAKEVRGEDESNLLPPNEPHKIIQFPKRKTLKASRLQGL